MTTTLPLARGLAVAGGLCAVALVPPMSASQAPASASQAAAAPRTMSDIMVKVLYPTADAVFYIETRTPTDEAGWNALQQETRRLADAAVELTIPRWARGRDRWL